MAEGLMKCIGCGDEMRLAHVNRHLHRERFWLFCTSCGPTFWTEANWTVVKQQTTIATAVRCVGCDRSVFIVQINKAIPLVVVFCFRCAHRMKQQHQWEEMRRTPRIEDLNDYAPKVIEVSGLEYGTEIKGGH